jgi:hypothetical protein
MDTLAGCAACWPSSADAAWEARKGLSTQTELVDESHFHVRLLGCSRCGQRFVSVFTEMIDWADGDDPQYWTMMPVTAEEKLALERANPFMESILNQLAPGRRSLLRSAPKGAPVTVCWGQGVFVGPHD